MACYDIYRSGNIPVARGVRVIPNSNRSVARAVRRAGIPVGRVDIEASERNQVIDVIRYSDGRIIAQLIKTSCKKSKSKSRRRTK